MDDLLLDAPESTHRPLASKELRFLNMVIDWVACAVLMVPVFFLIGMATRFANIYTDDLSNSFYKIIGYSWFVAYYAISEGAFNGRSLGKLVTGTRATTLDFEPIGFEKSFTRALCRVLPFEFISIFFSNLGPWHDRITKTQVVVWKKQTSHQK